VSVGSYILTSSYSRVAKMSMERPQTLEEDRFSSIKLFSRVDGIFFKERKEEFFTHLLRISSMVNHMVKEDAPNSALFTMVRNLAY
jgi:hypothetical protein